MLVVLGIAACGNPGTTNQNPGTSDSGAGDDPYKAAVRCTSGVTRSPNGSESSEMMPGRACNACHAEQNASSGEGDAPIFAFAGSVFPTEHEPDDCVASGA